MEYPGTKFTKKWRQLLFFTIIVLFFVLSPLVVLYAMGYTYDWQYGILRSTGALSVDVEPKNGSVYLNDVKLKKNTLNKKVEIKNIVPGKYALKIETKNYHDWSKDIEIENKETVYIKEIGLLKKNTEQLLYGKEISQFSLSPDGNFILYTDNNAKQLFLFNISNNNARKILDITNEEYSIKWADNNNCAYVTRHKNGYYNNINVICPTSNPIVIPLLDQEKINKIQWNNDINPILYFGTSKNIYSFTALTGRTQTISKNIFVDWYLVGNSLWTIQKSTTTKNLVLFEDALGFSKKFAEVVITENNNYSILDVNSKNILLIDNDKKEMLLLGENEKHKISAENYTISPYNDWWLIWSQYELWTYEHNKKPQLVNRSGENLKAVMPMDKFNTLALVWEDKVSALFPYYLVSSDLINIKTKQVNTDTKNKIMYFTREDKKGLWVLHY